MVQISYKYSFLLLMNRNVKDIWVGYYSPSYWHAGGDGVLSRPTRNHPSEDPSKDRDEGDDVGRRDIPLRQILQPDALCLPGHLRLRDPEQRACAPLNSDAPPLHSSSYVPVMRPTSIPQLSLPPQPSGCPLLPVPRNDIDTGLNVMSILSVV